MNEPRILKNWKRRRRLQREIQQAQDEHDPTVRPIYEEGYVHTRDGGTVRRAAQFVCFCDECGRQVPHAEVRRA